MKAIQYYGPQNIKYEEVMIKPPQEGEVVVKVMSALTCGTDVKTFRRGHPVLIKSVPSGFGHEFAGIVEKVGKGVENVKVATELLQRILHLAENVFIAGMESSICAKIWTY